MTTHTKTNNTNSYVTIRTCLASRL